MISTTQNTTTLISFFNNKKTHFNTQFQIQTKQRTLQHYTEKLHFPFQFNYSIIKEIKKKKIGIRKIHTLYLIAS